MHPQSSVRVSDGDTEREKTDNRRALCGQWKSHVSTWAFPDPGVRDIEIHNAVIILHNLNKSVILTSLLSGKRLMPGPLECVYRRLSTWQNHRQIYELLSGVTSKLLLISSGETSTVCVLSRLPNTSFNRRKGTYQQGGKSQFVLLPTTSWSHRLLGLLFLFQCICALNSYSCHSCPTIASHAQL